ncbi:DUF2975 domain-containing protein [Companilactobacillus keshanensis]|uniref:DUF2975 domain-containing protein n=1 Tax=Companilactobacillus keshanensis TaxID=2486003 RepID=A0ABW4BS40_9LACO|nr:DUF2975 domain-containing protein [Companilactobacillus keshanensis]
MKKLTTFLRLSLCIMLFFLTLITVFMFPNVLSFMIQVKTAPSLIILFGIGTYASAIGAYTIIFFAWRLLYLIDHDKAFSNSSLFSLNKIKWIGFSIAVIYILLIPSVVTMENAECNPLSTITNIFLIGLGVTIGIFANVLERICNHVVKFETENELTI